MSEQLSLPYIQIDKLATHKILRSRGDIGRGAKESWKIPFAAIEIRENFNTRYEYEGIAELAASILSQGLLEPLYVDVLENGKIYVERGHRRYYAIKYILDNLEKLLKMLPEGRLIPDFTSVECFINKSDMTERQRIKNLYGTNMHSKELKPLEQAETAWRYKSSGSKELSDEIIAIEWGVSRQTINNLITIAKASDDVKDQIKTGAMSFTNALAHVRASKKESKAADEAEEKSHQSSAGALPLPKDDLLKDLKELADLEERAEDFKQKEADRAARDLERLLDIANEVLVNKDSLTPHIGKRLAAPAYSHISEEFVDPEGGEIVPVERTVLLLAKDQEINESAIQVLIEQNAKSVYIYKVHTAAPSVFTEPPQTEEKGKYDMDRTEIAQIQNCIKLADKLEAIVTKLDVNEGVKKDVSDVVKWLQKDLDEVRTWIHNNKKFNKLR